jgi:hypothetical protein
MSNHDELIEWLESCDAARDSGEAELLLSKAAAAIRELVAERDALKLQANVLRQEKDCACAERDALKAARIAYAREFPPDDDGYPDVGNIHTNIRALKAENERLRRIEEAATEFVCDSYRPEPKHDAERFDRLQAALAGGRSDAAVGS